MGRRSEIRQPGMIQCGLEGRTAARDERGRAQAARGETGDEPRETVEDLCGRRDEISLVRVQAAKPMALGSLFEK